MNKCYHYICHWTLTTPPLTPIETTITCPRCLTTIEGVWVADIRCAVPVAIALRQSLIDIAAARQAGEGQHKKMDLIYRYLTGPPFRQRIETIVEKFSDMQADLDRERKAMMCLWGQARGAAACRSRSNGRHVWRLAGYRRLSPRRD